MNQYIEHIPAASVKASNISDWALSHGVGALTTEEIAHLTGAQVTHISQRMASLRKSGCIFSPARGLWVPIAPEYRTWGAPDPMVYIDDMMSFLNTDYRVGWLTSAALHGASHQASQVFQVAVEHPMGTRKFGRSRIEFYSRSKVGLMSLSLRKGYVARPKVASVGTTMLMLASDEGICGGMDNVATLLVELAEENLDFEAELLSDAHLFPDVAARRIGWILDEFGEGAPEGLSEIAASLRSASSYLSSDGERVGRLDRKWNLIVNKEVEPDL